MYFSVSEQGFFIEGFNKNIPVDAIEITQDKHKELLSVKNSGCIIFSDLTYSEAQPSQFHTWNGTEWVDNRTDEEIAEYERSLLPALTKRQFSLYLYDVGKYDEVMNALNANPRFKIEFETVATIERNSPTVTAMGQILEWDDLTIDGKWKEALEV